MMHGHDINLHADEGEQAKVEGEEMSSKNLKRGHDEAFPSETELSLMSKPDRKRFREKRRRDRVNASFDELRALLVRIDPQCSNRVDISQLELIDRSIVVINGLLEESAKNRQLLRDLDTIQRDRANIAYPFVNPFENESTSPIVSQLHAGGETSTYASQHGHSQSNPAPSMYQHQHQQPQHHDLHQSSTHQPVFHLSGQLSSFDSHEPGSYHSSYHHDPNQHRGTMS